MRAALPKLQHLALSPEQYAAWRAAHMTPVAKPVRITRIVVKSHGVVPERRIVEALHVHPGDAYDPNALNKDLLALTQDLNPGGLAFRGSFALPKGATIHIALPLAQGTYDVTGRVMHVEKSYTGNNPVYTHGIQFDDLSVDTRDAIELQRTGILVREINCDVRRRAGPVLYRELVGDPR